MSDPVSTKRKTVLVQVPLSRDLLLEEISVMDTLNKKFSDDEIALSFSNQTLTAHLIRLDPAQYQKIMYESINRVKLTPLYDKNLENPFAILMEKIYAIGSYGIRYKKRIYAGYADERKV
ncbi:MAG TPA: site-specific DNA-methyltransferase, partial [Methanospirillum sp.]|nr:site-specific DNA-methyltransferase [Methanospirillum sp.]